MHYPPRPDDDDDDINDDCIDIFSSDIELNKRDALVVTTDYD